MFADPQSGSGDMRRLFLQDQDLYGQVGNAGSHSAAPSQPEAENGSHNVGWGGQQLPHSNGYRVPWFGRNRNKGGMHRQQRAVRNELPYSKGDAGQLGSQASSAMLSRNQEDAMSVEEIVQVVKQLQRSEPLPDKVFRAMHHLDSRAVALLLKDLGKVGQDARSIELFNALRALPERHLLRSLCDVYTYTAMISLCIYQHNVETAMELLGEMRSRGIERNVHTYTALMNVCIKCGKLTTALDIFHNMKTEGCTPNVVTYNTLIDVHGKLGQWDRAVGVLKLMRTEGVMPALRTFNTLIIACNMCNQPREALAVYQELLQAGFEANSTTFNALISAYGKMGQLDRVLEVYKDMVWKGLERSVITYSSLISACEKAGRWETALQLFEEMQRDGCTPNTITYNSLITACGQGAHWERAWQVFEQMQANGCTPDVVTYTALISALERGGQWQLAYQAFQEMVSRGCRPDAIVYNAIIDALWHTGIVWAQVRARELFAMAVKQGHFNNERTSPDGSRIELNLHALTAGVAMLSLYSWLQGLQRKVMQQGEQAVAPLLAVVTDAGNASKEQGNFIIKEAVNSLMNFWGAPFRAVQDKTYQGMLEASGQHVARWVSSSAFAAQMAALLPSSTAESGPGQEQLHSQREASAQTQCSDAFGAVQQFEGSHNLVLQNMPLTYVQHRNNLVSGLLEKGAALGLKDELVHDAVLLLDRAASTAAQMPQELLPLVAAAALQLSISQSNGAGGHPDVLQALAEAYGVESAQVADMAWRLRQLLNDDIMAISTMRCLKVYLERVGYRYLDKQGVYIMAGLPTMLAVEALFDMSLLNCRPSVVAAALLYAERRQRGAVPFWPSVLAKMTGYEDLTTPELACAVRTAQKLCKKILYMQVYKAHSTNMAVQVAAQSQQQQQQQQQLPQAFVLAQRQVLSPAGTGSSFLSSGTPTPGALPSGGASMSRAYSTGSTGSASSGAACFVPAGPAPASSGSTCFVPTGPPPAAATGGMNLQGLSITAVPELPMLLPHPLTGPHTQMPLNQTFSGPLGNSSQLPAGRAGGVPAAAPALQAQVDYAMLAQLQCQPQHVQQQPVRGALQVVSSIPLDLTGIASQHRAASTGGMLGQVCEQTVFASPAAYVAAGAVLDGEGLAAPAPGTAVSADVNVSNVAYSLSLLGLNGPFDGKMNTT